MRTATTSRFRLTVTCKACVACVTRQGRAITRRLSCCACPGTDRRTAGRPEAAQARHRLPPTITSMPTRDQVIDSLRSVIDPELRRDIVELEMVRSVEIHENGVVDVMVSLTTPGCPIRSHFQTGVAEAVRKLGGVTGVNVSFDVLSDNEKAALGHKLGRNSTSRGRAGAGQKRDLRGLRQGWRRQVERDREPRRGARRRGQDGRRARRGCVGLLTAAHARPRRRAAAR